MTYDLCYANNLYKQYYPRIASSDWNPNTPLCYQMYMEMSHRYCPKYVSRFLNPDSLICYQIYEKICQTYYPSGVSEN